MQERPPAQAHWSQNSTAKAAGVSPSTAARIWRAHSLKPHLVKTFKLSNDPLFDEKLEDIVGLYINPPEHAVVLCADEKSQIQALDRAQPGAMFDHKSARIVQQLLAPSAQRNDPGRWRVGRLNAGDDARLCCVSMIRGWRRQGRPLKYRSTNAPYGVPAIS